MNGMIVIIALCVVAGTSSVMSASIGLATGLEAQVSESIDVLQEPQIEEAADVRDKREPKHGLFGGFGGSSSGSSASASAGSGSSGIGGFGGSDSHANAQSQTYSFGPFSASFSQASAGSSSQSSGGGGLFGGLF